MNRPPVHPASLFMLALAVLTVCATLLLGACDEEDAAEAAEQVPDDDQADDDLADDDAADDDTDAEGPPPGPVSLTPPPWPEWALQHWVWEDESTQESAIALVEGYLEHEIPVGAIIIDSPWATGYSTFAFDPALYPDPQAMIDHLHGLGARVMLWTVPAINVDSPNWQEAFDNGYLVSGGRTAHWWKGDGGFIDYNNPAALAWWHAQIDQVLDLGIDGWKCDAPEPVTWLWFGIETFTGTISTKEYQALYYGDFFHYTRERLGPDRIITARPVDNYGIPIDGPTFAPVEVNFAGWVGDQDPTFQGLKNALLNLFASSVYGYVNFGSDIAGYRGDEIRDRTLFVRWAQTGALSPVMENGGAGEHRPWMYDDEVLAIYRAFARLHHALIPYLYSQGAELFPLRVSVMRPTDRQRHEYMLGRDLFTAAMVSPDLARSVRFPEGGPWIDFWDGTEYAGGTEAYLAVPLDRAPLFVRRGAVLPLDLREGTVFSGSEEGLPPLTVLIYPRPHGTTEANVYEEQGHGAHLRAVYRDWGLVLLLSATDRAYAFCVKGTREPASVTVNPHGALPRLASREALVGTAMGWAHDAAAGDLWIKPGSAAGGLIVIVR